MAAHEIDQKPGTAPDTKHDKVNDASAHAPKVLTPDQIADVAAGASLGGGTTTTSGAVHHPVKAQ